MLSEARVKATCVSEVTAIGRYGFWLLSGDQEFFVPYQNCPVFKSATVEQIYAMQEIAPGQLRWKDLDADIELDVLECPERFTLKFAA